MEPNQEHHIPQGPSTPPSPIKRSILVRVKSLYLVLGLLCVAILIKILWIQNAPYSDDLRGQGQQVSFRTEIIEPMRGNILSADGRILTTTLPTYELRLDLAAQGITNRLFDDNVRGLADSLAAFFGDRPASGYLLELRKARMEKARYWRFAPRKVNFVELQRIKRFPLLELGQNRGGFIAVEANQRVRPLGNVASRTVGFVNTNGVKLGIEGGFDDVLRGVDGMTVKQKISGDFWIPIQSDLNVEPTPGLDVQTTLDIELQDIAQTSLRERIDEIEADWGTVVIMEVATGHIKAIANATRKKTGEVVEDYNYAVGISLEQGSTFKLATLIALLDDAKMPISEVIDTESGEVQIGQAKVRDSHLGYGAISLERAFEVSSNVAMAKAINRYYGGRPTKFLDALDRMGIGKPIGLQVMGEGMPVVKDPRNKKSGWDGTTLTMMSFGYALNLTSLQVLTLYNAVANNGVMVKPQLVTSLQEKGAVVKTFPTEVIRDRIASPTTIQTVQRAMQGVVLNGTARVLQSPKYTVAAKTGTAQVAMGRHGYQMADGSRHYLGSIAGYFPAQNPKYSMIISIKTFYRAGSNKVYYGGALASPVFKAIADRIYGSSFHFLRPVAADSSVDMTRGVRAIEGGRVAVDSMGIPNVVGLDARAALGVLEGAGYQVRIAGRGARVVGYTSDSTAKIVMLQMR